MCRWADTVLLVNQTNAFRVFSPATIRIPRASYLFWHEWLIDWLIDLSSLNKKEQSSHTLLSLKTSKDSDQTYAYSVDAFFFLLFFYNCIVSLRFFPWEIVVAFPGESLLRQSRATQRSVHAGCFSVYVIRRTLTWTTGSVTCAQMLVRAVAHGGI